MKNPPVYGETVSGENFCKKTREIMRLLQISNTFRI